MPPFRVWPACLSQLAAALPRRLRYAAQWALRRDFVLDHGILVLRTRSAVEAAIRLRSRLRLPRYLVLRSPRTGCRAGPSDQIPHRSVAGKTVGAFRAALCIACPHGIGILCRDPVAALPLAQIRSIHRIAI